MRLLLVSGLIGIPVSLAAFALLSLLHALEHAVWVDLPHRLGFSQPPWWWPLPCLFLAGLLVGIVVRWFPGHGGHPPIDGISAAPMPLAHLPGVLLAALAGLSLGVVLGPEAPLLALGTGLAVLLARPAGVTADRRFATVVGVAGAAAALSVVLGNPLIAAVFLLEAVGLAGRQLTAVVLPCLASAGIGALVFTGLGAWTGLAVDRLALTLPPGEARLDLPDVVWAIAMAVVTALAVSVTHRIGHRVAARVPGRRVSFTIGAAVVVGLCASAYGLLTGRDPAEAALSGQATLVVLAGDPRAWPTGAVVVLILIKAIAYGVSLGAFRGGPIFPAVFLGAAIGVLCAPLPGLGATPAIAAGMAAATAAAMPFPVAAAVLVLLLLGGPRSVIAAVVAYDRPHAAGAGPRTSESPVTTAAAPLAPEAVARLDVRPDAVAVFDRDWCIRYANGATARLLGRPAAELVGRNIWVALPELGGTFFHAFLLRARSSGAPVTWAGFYPPAGRWLEATAAVDDDLLQVSARVTDHRPDDHHRAAGAPADPDEGADRRRFLAEVSETLIATLDSGRTAARLAELAVTRLCDWAFVALRGEDGRFGEDAWAHRDPARRADLDTYLTGRLRAAGDAVLSEALLSGAPVHLATLDQDRVAATLPTEEVRAAWRRLGTTSCLIVPLRSRGETLGALALLNAGDRPPHTEMQIATAVEVARRGALALDNACLYDRQLKVAETLQQSLLTAPPRLEGLQIAARYRPAAAYQQVGGDWYDAFRSDGASVLVIGDVVGHDVAASAAMGQIRSMLRTIACDRAEGPAQTLRRVDRVLTTLGVGALATALVAHLEPPAEQAPAGPRTLRWSSAGHLPPLLARRDGGVHVLTSRPERLLGTGAPGPRTDHATALRPGDTLLLYTDGLVEHGHRDLDEGIAQLTSVLGDLAEPPLDELCDQVLDRLVTGRTDDDIALLAIRDDRAQPW